MVQLPDHFVEQTGAPSGIATPSFASPTEDDCYLYGL